MPKLTATHLVVNRNVRIPLAEIELSTSRSSGPGGQHANKTESRVEAVWSIEDSDSIGPGQRSRLMKKLGPVARAVAQDERSQLRNRELALDRLGVRIAEGLIVPRRRVATKPSQAAQRRRRQQKTVRSEVKSSRRKPTVDD
ncbi:MAG: alternative ribosome rescue aminoacyl-tRNA hydrolase ArfB [Solirubrobacterales bacterium]